MLLLKALKPIIIIIFLVQFFHLISKGKKCQDILSNLPKSPNLESTQLNTHRVPGRHCARGYPCFVCFSYQPYGVDNTSLALLPRWRNQGWKKLSNLPQILEQESGRAGIRTQTFWIQVFERHHVVYLYRRGFYPLFRFYQKPGWEVVVRICYLTESPGEFEKSLHPGNIPDRLNQNPSSGKGGGERNMFGSYSWTFSK